MSLLLLSALASYHLNFECKSLNPKENITVILSQNPRKTHPMSGPQLEGEMEVISGDFQDKIKVQSYARDWTWITTDIDNKFDKYWLIQRQHDDRMFEENKGAPVTLNVKLENMPFPQPIKYELFCQPIQP